MQTSNGGFPPEVLNRFGVTIPFNTLSQETMIHLMNMKYEVIKKKFFENLGVRVNTDVDVINTYLGKDILGTSTEDGAGRQVNRVLDTYIVQPVSTYICKNPRARNLHLKIEGQLRTGNKDIVDSTAHIVIEEV